MDWDSRDAEVFQNDVDELLIYEPRDVVVVAKIAANTPCTPENKNEQNIIAWLDEAVAARNNPSATGVWVIFGDTVPEPEGLSPLLINLPFTKPTFQSIISSFWVNTSISRALVRNAPIFNRTRFTPPNNPSPSTLLSYNIRTQNSEAPDMAMSVTTDPTRGVTYAIVYGCGEHIYGEEHISSFIERLNRSGEAFNHPMLLPGLFAEIQREKHRVCVKEDVAALLERVVNIGRDGKMKVVEPGTEDDDEYQPKEVVDLWLKVGYLSCSLEAWKAQLQKMVEHVEELEREFYGEDPVERPAPPLEKSSEKGGESSAGAAGATATTTTAPTTTTTTTPKPTTKYRNPTMYHQGRRIHERLRDILAEYTEMTQKCAWVTAGLSLANDMSWNHLARLDSKLTTQIAAASKEDSTQMKSIALLTMVFLPGTFVASFFAMPLFKWDADPDKGERVYSRWFWIYWIVAPVLTVVVLVLWGCGVWGVWGRVGRWITGKREGRKGKESVRGSEAPGGAQVNGNGNIAHTANGAVPVTITQVREEKRKWFRKRVKNAANIV